MEIVPSNSFPLTLYENSATSNETLSFSGNISSSLKTFFPSLNSSDLEGFLLAYPSDQFSSEDQRLQVATGESELICAVSTHPA